MTPAIYIIHHIMYLVGIS